MTSQSLAKNGVPNLNGFGGCPLPFTDYDRVLLGHGSGGKLTAELMQRVFLPEFTNDVLAAMEDQATVSVSGASGNGVKVAAVGVHHRFICRAAVVLPRRGHRQTRRARHGE